ncbi:hypothetical protein LguiB_027034 [Lonicera macranthoides]
MDFNLNSRVKALTFASSSLKFQFLKKVWDLKLIYALVEYAIDLDEYYGPASPLIGAVIEAGKAEESF